MSRPARIALTLEQCWQRVPGGTATSALESIRALQAHTELDLVGVSAFHRQPPAAPWRPSIPVHGLPLPRRALYESWHRGRRPNVERAVGKVDVIHATGMAVPPRSAPLVVTVHDLAFRHEPDLFTPRGVRYFTRAIELARQEADLVICPSQATMDDCRADGFAPDRLRLVPWGVDGAAVPPDEIDRVRRRYHLDQPFVMWAGTIEPRKNVPALLDAFARLSPEHRAVELVLAGPEGWNDELAAISSRLGGRVRRLGFLPAADLRALYAAAEVFCFPSRYEGFGLPVLEAMAQGTPVVTSVGTATAEVVGGPGEDVAGLTVDPHDVDALAGALDQVLGDPVAARAMADSARARAATFSWERTAALLAGVYAEVQR